MIPVINHAGEVMHLVGGTIKYQIGGSPDSVTFTAYIKTRPAEILTGSFNPSESSLGCGYQNGYYWIQCGNFTSNWDIGDILHIDFSDSRGHTITEEISLTYAEIDTLNVVFVIPTYQITITTIPPGLECIVDEASYSTPYTFSVIEKTVHEISVNSPQSSSTGIRHVFNSWSDLGAQTHNIKVNNSEIYVAQFKTEYQINSYVKPDTAGYIILTPDQDWYLSGSEIIVEAFCDTTTAYMFSKWSGDVIGKTNPDTLIMDGSKNFTANFILKRFSLIVEVTPPGTGTVLIYPSEREIYDYLDTLHLYADPAIGFKFRNWENDITETENPVMLIMDTTKYVVARFKVDPKYVNVEDDVSFLPAEFRLMQNYPNPFNMNTKISYHLSQNSKVTLQIFNGTGEKVRTLIDCEKRAGCYDIMWDAFNDEGKRISSGIYFYKIKMTGVSEDFTETRKMVLMK
jgi:hypothetical protein